MAATSLPPSRRIPRGNGSRETPVTPTIEHGHKAARKARAGTVKMTEGTGEMPRHPAEGLR